MPERDILEARSSRWLGWSVPIRKHAQPFPGLRLCGIADEPACPSANGSRTSRTSVRCKCRISVAKRSSEAAITANVERKYAHVGRAGPPASKWLPRRAQAHGRRVLRCAEAPSHACPRAPEILPTAIASIASASRRRLRRVSSTHPASLRPNVVGSPWMPCERPMQSVYLCSTARLVMDSLEPLQVVLR